MLVKVNGEGVELPDGSTVRDAIESSGAPYIEGCVLGVIKGKEEIERHVNKYSIKTNKGSIIIELMPEASKNLVETWKQHYKEFENLRIRWTTSNEVSLGPVKTDLTPSRDEYRYDRWDVILSLSGFTADSTHIIFSKTKHDAVYGAPAENKGVFARVVGGKKTIMELTDEDHIREVKPVLERESTVKSATITDLNTPLADGNEIFTHVLIKPTDKSPESVEHLFAVLEKEKLTVDYESDSFVGFYGLQGLERNPEYVDQRRRGTVTLRNRGVGVGRVYIYREDRVSTPSHTVVGKVKSGIQLIDMVQYGDHITLKTDVDRIMTLSMTQSDAEEFLASNGVEQVREGLTDDDAIVVGQDPMFTMDIVGQKKLKTFAVPKENIIQMEFDENAPRSSWYFKKITGLLDSPVGSLKVHFAFPGMKVMMFEGDSKQSKGLIPENVPLDCVKAGQIGLTNMSRRHIGMLGVRFEDNDEFGPTGEPFGGTNIVGNILRGMESLEKVKDGDIVYVTTKKL